MSNDTSTKKRPAYRIYAVNKRTGRKSQWLAIGAAWPHDDLRGLSLQFDAKPLDGADVVLREITEDKSPTGEEEPQA